MPILVRDYPRDLVARRYNEQLLMKHRNPRRPSSNITCAICAAHDLYILPQKRSTCARKSSMNALHGEDRAFVLPGNSNALQGVFIAHIARNMLLRCGVTRHHRSTTLDSYHGPPAGCQRCMTMARKSRSARTRYRMSHMDSKLLRCTGSACPLAGEDG